MKKTFRWDKHEVDVEHDRFMVLGFYHATASLRVDGKEVDKSKASGVALLHPSQKAPPLTAIITDESGRQHLLKIEFHWDEGFEAKVDGSEVYRI